MRADLLDLLRDADPSPELTFLPTPDDPALTRILSAVFAPHHGDDAAHVAPRPRRHRSLLTLAAAAAVAIALWPSGPTAPAAFAKWVNDPILIAPEDISPWLEYSCDPQRFSEGSQPTDGPNPSTIGAVEPVLVERRGDLVLMVQAGADGWLSCLVNEAGWGGFRSLAGDPDHLTGVFGESVTSTDTYEPQGERWVATAGQVSDDVVRVEITLATGYEVTASVAGGFYAAWWPSIDEPGRSSGFTLTAYDSADEILATTRIAPMEVP